MSAGVSQQLFSLGIMLQQGRGSYFEVGGGGQTSPGAQGNPYPKLKTPWIWPTIFGRDQSSRAKTNKNKNERLSQFKVGGGGAEPPQPQSCEGKLPPLPPPGTRFLVLQFKTCLFCLQWSGTIKTTAHQWTDSLTLAPIRCFATFGRTGGGGCDPPLAFPNEAS